MNYTHAAPLLSRPAAAVEAVAGEPDDVFVAAPPRHGPSAGAWSTGMAAVGLFVIAVMLVLLSGCEGQVSLLPNSDPALRKTPAEFAADAARRHPYKAEAPRGGNALGRASVDYGADQIQITNVSDEDWTNVELWVNKTYVVFLPKLDKGATHVTTVSFRMIYDETGKHFPLNNGPKENQVYSLELLRDGKMYDVPKALAD